ncbi:MAG: signal recognition particle protein, partial [Clostridia bacterium]|nr:signal recognition particle protein [Clostridia bacterium]
RGGAALSIKAVTGKPIKLCGIGEKMGDLEPFYPDRMASRILGMGDVLTLIERAQEMVTEEQAEKLEKKFKEANFTFDDYLEQFENMKNLGSMQDIMAMIPGMSGRLKDVQIDERQIERTKAIIRSMTPEERRNPQVLNGSRRKRIALGSGVTVQEVNALIKQYEQTNQMMKAMRGGKRGRRFPFGF